MTNTYLDTTNYADRVAYFEAKQKEILKLNQEFEIKKATIVQKVEEEIRELQKPLIEAGERYRAELKAWIGITDGEKMNVLEVVKAIRTVQSTV